MDTIIKSEIQALRTIADAHPSLEGLFVDYLVATQTGDEDRARMAKAFIIFYASA